MGGAQIYREALSVVDRMYITVVERDYEGDTSFPEIDFSQWELVNVVRHERGEAVGEFGGGGRHGGGVAELDALHIVHVEGVAAEGDDGRLCGGAGGGG